MAQVKHCHRALQVRSKLLGLDLLDLLVLVAISYPVGMLVGVLAGLGVAVVLGVCLRVIKWGRLPDFTLDLVLYAVVVPECTPVTGQDAAPLHPIATRSTPWRR